MVLIFFSCGIGAEDKGVKTWNVVCSVLRAYYLLYNKLNSTKNQENCSQVFCYQADSF